MSLDRREFIHLTASSVIAGSALKHLTGPHTRRARYRAVVFDGFPIFDPRPVFALAERLFPGKGAELSNAWRAPWALPRGVLR